MTDDSAQGIEAGKARAAAMASTDGMEQRSAVGDFAYQVATNMTAAGLGAGAKIVYDKVTKKDAPPTDQSQDDT